MRINGHIEVMRWHAERGTVTIRSTAHTQSFPTQYRKTLNCHNNLMHTVTTATSHHPSYTIAYESGAPCHAHSPHPSGSGGPSSTGPAGGPPGLGYRNRAWNCWFRSWTVLVSCCCHCSKCLTLSTVGLCQAVVRVLWST